MGPILVRSCTATRSGRSSSFSHPWAKFRERKKSNESCLEYRGYHAAVTFDADDGIFVGTVIGIADSLSFHGESVKELTSAFHACIDDYLDHCRQIGKQPDKEYRGSLNIRLSPDAHRQAAIYAAGEGKTLDQFIGEAVSDKCKAYARGDRPSA